MNSKIKGYIIVALVASLLIGGVAAAGYMMRSPDSDPGNSNATPSPAPTASPSPTPAPQATLSKVTITPSTVTAGQSWTLSTTVSDEAAGLTVDFYNQNGVLVGSGITDDDGLATATITPPVGTWIYHANAQHP